jgi:hypothetical protein
MSITVTWSPSSETDIASYEIARSAASAGPWVVQASVIHNLTGPNITNGLFFWTDPTGTTSHWYRIVVIDGAGQRSAETVFQVDAQAGISQVNIVNQALSICGIKRRVTYMADGTPEAIQANLWYGTTRDTLLQEYRWNFATKRFSPTALTTVTDGVTSYVSRGNWTYTFAVPLDFLALQYIDTGLQIPAADQRIPYALEPSTDGTAFVVCCDYLEPDIVYTAQISETKLYPSYFVEALAWRLALNLILPLSVKMEYARAIGQGAETALRKAIMLGCRQGQEGALPDSEFIRVRL